MNKEDEMKQSAEMPLVSMLILTYNFKKYVEATIAAALAQDYPNLEIVISDDCSTDGTWEILQKIIAEYLDNGGAHRVVANRNATNMGFIPHFEHAQRQCHGELIVYNDGDDVSNPRRVSAIVNEWIKSNRQCWVLYSRAILIDVDGFVIGKLSERKAKESVLGAIATYRRGMNDIFGPIVEQGASQDEVYGNRALMLGPRGFVDEELLQYRIGSGESSGFANYRARRIKELKSRAIGSQRQLLRDIEHIKDRLGVDYNFWRETIEEKLNQNLGMLDLLSGESFWERYCGMRKLNFKKTLGQEVLYVVLLLPHCIADFILAVGANGLDCIRRLMRRRSQW